MNSSEVSLKHYRKENCGFASFVVQRIVKQVVDARPNTSLTWPSARTESFFQTDEKKAKQDLQKLDLVSNHLLFFTAGSGTSAVTRDNTSIHSDFQTPAEFSGLVVEVLYLNHLYQPLVGSAVELWEATVCMCVHHVGCVLQAQQAFGSHQP